MKIENKSEIDYFVTKNKRTTKKPRKQRKDNWNLKFAVFVYLILPGIILSIVISMAFKVSDRTLYDFTQWYISFPITGFIVGLFLLFRHHILHSDEINYKDFIQWKYSLSLIWLPTVGALFISPILIGCFKMANYYLPAPYKEHYEYAKVIERHYSSSRYEPDYVVVFHIENGKYPDPEIRVYSNFYKYAQIGSTYVVTVQRGFFNIPVIKEFTYVFDPDE